MNKTPRTLNAETIKAAIAQMTTRWNRKVLVVDLWQVAAPADVELDAFKTWLLEQHLAGTLTLSRWDLRGTEPGVAESETNHLNATYHQVSL